MTLTDDLHGRIKRRARDAKASLHDFQLEVPQQQSKVAPGHVWTNKDLDPTPPDQWTWTSLSVDVIDTSPFVIDDTGTGDVIHINGWLKYSNMIKQGLDWRNAFGAVVVGSIILAIPMMANGKIGSVNRIPFPVALRASFGYYLAIFGVVSRAVIALFFFGIQTYNGATATSTILAAIWPSFSHIKNGIPASQGISTQTMIAYVVFWFAQLPFLFIHPSRIRALFLAKMILVPISALAILGWCVHEANRTTAGVTSLLKKGPTVQGEEFAQAWLYSMNAVIGGFATLALNIPDFTRYSKTNKSQIVQVPWIPLTHLLLCAVAVICASCTQAFHHSLLWSPIQIIDLWPNRAARFFAAVPWIFAQICVNISANSISCANDLVLLFPRWLTIKRGQIVVAVIGAWVCVPWKIIASPNTFYAFISGYSIVLGPLAGIMCADYYFIKKQKLDVPALYDPSGRYSFWKGCNWRALVAFIIGIGPNVPGFINGMNKNIPLGGTFWIFKFSWAYGFTSSIVAYTAVGLAFPDRSGSIIDKAVYAQDVAIENSMEMGSGKDADEDDKVDGAVYVQPA